MPLHMRLPKLKGFKNPFKVEFQVVNLDQLAALFPEGGTVGVDELVAAGAVRKNQPVKVLGNGELAVALQVSAHAFSATAKRRSPRPAARSPRSPDRVRPVRSTRGVPRVITRRRRTPLLRRLLGSGGPQGETRIAWR